MWSSLALRVSISSLRRRTVVALVVLIVLLALHPLWLRMLAWPLQSAASSSPADYYCLHGGEMGVEGYEPFDRAARWQGKAAGTVLLLTPCTRRIVEIGAVRSFEQTCRSELAKRKIAPANIEVIDAQAQNAWQEASALSTWLKQHPQATVCLSCTTLASGRLRYVFDKVLGPDDSRRVGFELSFDPDRPPDAWWRSRAGVKDFMYGWLELLWAWRRGDDASAAQLGAAAFQQEVRATVGEAPR